MFHTLPHKVPSNVSNPPGSFNAPGVGLVFVRNGKLVSRDEIEATEQQQKGLS